MKNHIGLFLLAAGPVTSFSWVPGLQGVDSTLITPGPSKVRRDDKPCPFNPDHKPAVPISKKYPYLGAKNGLPGTGKGGIRVPAPGDKAHYFHPPGPNDIRGPCPGLNTAANHNFIAHDGIVTLNELVDAQQNVYNVDYGLAVALAVLGLGFDGDMITEKLSIGCDATNRTSLTGSLIGDEGGLNTHNKFEGDTSLTRMDYYLNNGDDYTPNATMFGNMAKVCNGIFEYKCLTEYRHTRYLESVRDNPNFFFGPGSTLLFGAASFLYELFADFGPEGTPDLPTISSFFGMKQNKDKSFTFINEEKIPDKWHNRRKPYTTLQVGEQIQKMNHKYQDPEGGNTAPGNFVSLNAGRAIVNGQLTNSTPAGIMCYLYQTVTSNVPSQISKVYSVPQAFEDLIVAKLAPQFKDFGCPGLPL